MIYVWASVPALFHILPSPFRKCCICRMICYWPLMESRDLKQFWFLARKLDLTTRFGWSGNLWCLRLAAGFLICFGNKLKNSSETVFNSEEMFREPGSVNYQFFIWHFCWPTNKINFSNFAPPLGLLDGNLIKVKVSRRFLKNWLKSFYFVNIYLSNIFTNFFAENSYFKDIAWPL